MKRILLISFIALSAILSMSLTGCGPVAATIAADAARISLSAPAKKTVVVKVDDRNYNMKTVKDKPNQPATPQNVRQNSKNTVQVDPGQHTVQVTEKKTGREVYNNRVDVKQDEHRVIGVK